MPGETYLLSEKYIHSLQITKKKKGGPFFAKPKSLSLIADLKREQFGNNNTKKTPHSTAVSKLLKKLENIKDKNWLLPALKRYEHFFKKSMKIKRKKRM